MNEDTALTDAVVGIDVAKQKVDLFAVIHGKGKSKVFENTRAGHRELQTWLGDRGFALANTHLCMEATGPVLGITGYCVGERRLEGQRGQSGTH